MTPSHQSEDFNLIADKIIHRVKNDLGVSHYPDGDRQTFPKDREDAGSSSGGAEPLSSHLCQKCKHLMVSRP